MGFAERLRALMDARGISGRELARQVPCDRSYVSLLAQGKRHPSHQTAERLDELLGAGGELAALVFEPVHASRSGRLAAGPDADLYDRITRAVDTPAHVDAAVIDWLENTLAEHRRVEDTIGARPLFGPVRAQLSVVADFTRAAPDALQDRLVGLAAEHAQFLAWMCVDTRNLAAALAWYDRAHDWALEAGDPDMAASTLSMKAHLAWSRGDPKRCIRMAEAARWHEGTTPGVQGMAAQMTARGHALGGEADPAHRLLDEAQVLIAKAAEHPEDEPPWMYFYGETWFTLQRGMAELHLRNWRQAADLLMAGLERLPGSYRRDRAWYGACLARAHAEAGDAEQGAAVAVAHAGDIMSVNSYARGELNRATAVLVARGSREGQTIREALAATANEMR